MQRRRTNSNHPLKQKEHAMIFKSEKIEPQNKSKYNKQNNLPYTRTTLKKSLSILSITIITTWEDITIFD